MPYRARLSLAAEVLILDSLTNSVTAAKIIEDAKVQAFPVVIPTISFLTSVGRDSTDPEIINAVMRLTLDEEEILTDSIELNFLGRLGSRYFSHIQGLVVPKPGILRFEVRAVETDLLLASYEVRLSAVEPRLEQQALFDEPIIGESVESPEAL